MVKYRVRVVRKIDGFRAEIAGKKELTIFDSILPAGTTRDQACAMLVGMVLYEVGINGDGENGGNGNLVNCWGDVFHTFMTGNWYSYADVEFRIEEVY